MKNGLLNTQVGLSFFIGFYNNLTEWRRKKHWFFRSKYTSKMKDYVFLCEYLMYLKYRE
jgi:hypothetical protein